MLRSRVSEVVIPLTSYNIDLIQLLPIYADPVSNVNNTTTFILTLSPHRNSLCIFEHPQLFSLELFSMSSSGGSSRPGSPESESTRLASARSQSRRHTNHLNHTSDTRRPPRSTSSSLSSLSSSDFKMGDYSIDLSKLGGNSSNFSNGLSKKDSSMAPTPPQRDVDAVSSHDDGPTDFTLNMEQWMRGEQPYAQQGTEAPNKSAAPPNPTIEDYHDESAFVPQSTSTPVHRASSKHTATETEPRKSRTAELEAQLKNANTRIATSAIQLKNLQTKVTQMKGELKGTSATQTTQIEDLSTKLERMKKEKQTLATELATTQSESGAKITSLETQLETSNAAQAAAISSARLLATELQHAQQQLQSTLSLVETMQSAINHTAQQRKVPTAVTRSTASQTDIEAPVSPCPKHSPPNEDPDKDEQRENDKSTIAALTAHLAEAHAALDRQSQHHHENHARMEKEIIATATRHEAHWEARIQALTKQSRVLQTQKLGLEREKAKLEKEKKFMGKVLMQMWGREECGVGPGPEYTAGKENALGPGEKKVRFEKVEKPRQAYRYKYFTRQGAAGGDGSGAAAGAGTEMRERSV